MTSKDFIFLIPPFFYPSAFLHTSHPGFYTVYTDILPNSNRLTTISGAEVSNSAREQY